MDQLSSTLPKEKNVKTSTVSNVSEFISRVNDYIKARNQKNVTVVYRGEADIYDMPCRPNIFRKGVMDGSWYFEKSLFDTMRQNKLSGEKRYLDNAIDAQHGEFPSRLLDVTYNCLTALYFAVTPYYHFKEDHLDDKDGMVFLFFIDEIFSPSARNTNDNYDAIINRDRPWYNGTALFSKNHKFIDHAKLNNRIIAQQGAFILFPGDEPESLPEYMGYGILIPHEAKPFMRRELKQLFGIYTGSIYPEIINLVEELSGKSQRLNTEEFNCKNELDHAVKQLDKELDYYLYYAIENKRARTGNMDQILMHVEHVADSYRKGLLEFIRDCHEVPEERSGRDANEIPVTQGELREVIERYNSSVRRCAETVREYGLGDFSEASFRIQLS